jgi:hypothetical protein
MISRGNPKRVQPTSCSGFTIFKKHIRIAVDSLPATKMPRTHRPISFGGATNGAVFENGITLTNSYYSAYIRTPVDAEEKSARGLSVAIETALFGL